MLSFRLLGLSALLLTSVAGAGQLEVRVCLYEGPRPSPERLRPLLGTHRGTVYLTRHGSAWLVINRLDIEEYLYGVVGKEMGATWPAEALMAQAVCSRSFVLRRMTDRAGGGGPYDVKNTTADQVFGACEDDRIISAVEATRGQVLVDGCGQIVAAHFHTACGGRTAAPDSVWGGPSVGAEGVECAFCASGPYSSWRRVIPKSVLASALGLGSVLRVEVIRADAGGRILDLKVASKGGTLVSVSGQKLRLALYDRAGNQSFGNPRTLPSMLCTVQDAGDSVVFVGRGFGHGVGMCQQGARTLATRGASYEEILTHYFPAATLGTIQREGDRHGDPFVLHRTP